MNICLVVLGLLILALVDAQTTGSDVETNTGFGSDGESGPNGTIGSSNVTITTTQNPGISFSSGEEATIDFVPGGTSVPGGTNAPTSCGSIILFVSNINVSQDVDCNAADYVPQNIDLAVFFGSVGVGQSAVANITCNQACDNLPREIGRIECQSGGIFSAATWTNCAQTLDQQTSEEQADNAATATSDPDQTSSTAVTGALDSLTASLSGSFTNAVATTAVTAIGNVFSVTQTVTQTTVRRSLNRVFTLIRTIQAQVTLTTDRDGAFSWEFSVRSFATCIVSDISRARNFVGSDYYFTSTGNNFTYDESGKVDLAQSNMQLIKDEEPTGPYISAKGVSADRLNFSMILGDAYNLESIPNLATNNSVLYHCAMEGVTCSLHIITNSPITLNSTTHYSVMQNATHTTYTRLEGVKYNLEKGEWEDDTNCVVVEADNYHAKMNCIGSSLLTIRERTVAVKINGSLGLSSAGISGTFCSTLLALLILKILGT